MITAFCNCGDDPEGTRAIAPWSASRPRLSLLAVGDGAEHVELWRSAEDGVDLTPGPHVVADPNSPTGYTGHFVYYNPTATSVRFVGGHPAAQLGGPDGHDGLPALSSTGPV